MIAKAKPKPLRFAALIRVSTEKQEKRGESLRTQDKQIAQAAEGCGGGIASRYAGQEHATAGQERKILERLLADATKKPRPFDAVMVADPSRWTRNNVESEKDLDHLRSHGVRFFVLGMEFDLFDPTQRFVLAQQAGMNQYQAALQKQKSVLNCIEFAEKGIPASGKKPYGRTFDKGTWGVDAKKKEDIEAIAKRYLAGESLAHLAAEYDFNHSFLHKTLTQRCGDSHTITWDVPELNIHKTVTIKIPRLLPDKTIKAIRQRAQANKTYLHGKPKHPYLLAGMVFCGHCGYGMFGQTNHGNRRYYRHAHTPRARKCRCHPRPWVRCDELEHVVMQHLFETFGNPKAVQRAIDQATPNREKVEAARQRQESIAAELKKTEAARQRILGLVSKGTITDAQAEKQLGELNQKEARLLAELERLQETLANIPTPAVVKAVSKQVVARFYSDAKLHAKKIDANARFDKMTWEEKRALVEEVFSGGSPSALRAGRPMGIYIEAIDGQTDHRHKRWSFTLHGKLVEGNQLVTPRALGCTTAALRGCRWRGGSVRPAA